MSKHSSTGKRWEKIRQVVFSTHGRQCVYCGNEATAIDHVIPKAKGGTDTLDNLVPACTRCNSIKKDNVKKRINYYNKNWITAL